VTSRRYTDGSDGTAYDSDGGPQSKIQDFTNFDKKQLILLLLENDEVLFKLYQLIYPKQTKLNNSD
jgi:hypothetical protein